MSRVESFGTGHAAGRLGPMRSFQKVDKEILREVLRILPAITAPPDKGVNRVAINTIELVQGRAGFRGALSEAAATNPHWVVRNLGRPPAVESSTASSKPDFVRKHLWRSRKVFYFERRSKESFYINISAQLSVNSNLCRGCD